MAICFCFLASCLDKEQNGLIAHRTCFVNLEPRCVAALSLFIAMMMCNFGRFDICQKANCSSSSRSSHFSPFDAHFAAQTQQTIFFRISCNGRRIFPDEQRKKKLADIHYGQSVSRALARRVVRSPSCLLSFLSAK